MALGLTAGWLRKFGAPVLGVLLAFVQPATTASAEGQPGGGTETIDVLISPLRSSRGNVFVAVYDQRGWLVPGRFRTYRNVPANAAGVRLQVSGLARGRYAVAVFHDENKNGRVDKNWLGLPSEGFGFSRLTPLRVPRFDEVSFPTGGSAVAQVRMRY